ncbi:GIY-YIG nuclease family protein [Actinobacillus equuli]|uniref:GIY-YIG nuclease family protein n=1 Tax=Actinobacillus equuli TaxID=718 RepID=UPI002418413D|nr:GIY-YIG nuclease family protein [Actinobacillus equuli]MDG4953337.1 GIY-YIG nuclease family protein [Actinobacillus equuli subsp. equuli]WGE41826.1 GIY-YIG nuclease family protein [Actinobacillus equuli subsp. haemolyticus]
MILALQRKQPASLDELFASDEFGLFADVKEKQITPEHQTLINNYREVVDFVEKYGREPSEQGNLNEKLLARRLKSLRNDPASGRILGEIDNVGILSRDALSASSSTAHQDNGRTQCVPTSIEDIFNSDDFGLLDIGDSSIFELTHVPPPDKITHYEGELIGTRTKCEEFSQFSAIFDRLHLWLKHHEIKTERSRTENIAIGDAFILQGMLCVVVDKQDEERQSTRKNARLRIIFENGTESNMLSRSLSVALGKDETSKKLMTGEHFDWLLQQIQATTNDKATGYIYVVKLAHPKGELAQIPNLYKIGFTSTTLAQRIANCENDIAFLESQVKPVVRFACFDLDPHKLETLLHTFFAAQRLQVTLISKDGLAYQPKEWFSVELASIEFAIERILDGSIGEYRMDNTMGRIVKKMV